MVVVKYFRNSVVYIPSVIVKNVLENYIENMQLFDRNTEIHVIFRKDGRLSIHAYYDSAYERSDYCDYNILLAEHRLKIIEDVLVIKTNNK